MGWCSTPIIRESRDIPINGTSTFCNNQISTSKYNVVTFLPKNLFEQFHRLANWYFLVVIILNFMLSVFGKEISFLPLLFVLGSTMAKDLYEDIRRHQHDGAINTKMCHRLKQGGTEEPIQWKDVKVGDMLAIKRDEAFPADVILLSSSEKDGVAFVSTMNLDGETNLKVKTVAKGFPEEYSLAQLTSLRGHVTAEPPQEKLHAISGEIVVSSQQQSLDPSVLYDYDNVLLRGCYLRNVDSVIVFVVFTGHETKAMLNSGEKRSKRSKLEGKMNAQIAVLAFILFMMCLTVAIGTSVWERTHEHFPLKERRNPNWEAFLAFWASVIVFQVMIPVALYVMFELIKLVISKLIEQDLTMFDADSNKRAQARALNIPEDLGQIQYIFSDKTGTLTDNVMELRRLYMPSLDREFVVGDDVLATGDNGGQSEITELFLLALTVCNTVLPDAEPVPSLPQLQQPQNTTHVLPAMTYQGESPDEIALVKGAIQFGSVLKNRSLHSMQVVMADQPITLQLLGVLPFDSNRKCMSVIIRVGRHNNNNSNTQNTNEGRDGGGHNETDQIVLFTKGADTSIVDRLATGTQAENTRMSTATDQLARNGLRILWFGYRHLTTGELEKYLELHKAKKHEESFTYLEHSLFPLGVTGVEDKLQDKVPETIYDLHLAGIRIWVLTGDKRETAINIAETCNLIPREMNRCIIDGKSCEECTHAITTGLQQLRQNTELAVVVTGEGLRYALDNMLKDKFFELTSQAQSVLCCRVTPKQKGEVVKMVKEKAGVTTLAVGDGANDVAMLKEAHVGVGIRGNEGEQAVMNSDYAIARFKFLRPLLLVHGHWAYHRLGYMVLYFLYKNAVFALLLFWYHFYTGWSPTTTIDEISLIVYSVIYTSFPPLAHGALEQDIDRQKLLAQPWLYAYGRQDQLYNWRNFGLWVVDMFWQSLVVFFIPLYAYTSNDNDGVWAIGVLHLWSMTFVVNIVLWLDTHYHTLIFDISLLVSVALTMGCTFLLHLNPVDKWYSVVQNTSQDGLFWLTLLCTTSLAILPHAVHRAYVLCWPTAIATPPKHAIIPTSTMGLVGSSSMIMGELQKECTVEDTTPEFFHRPSSLPHQQQQQQQSTMAYPGGTLVLQPSANPTFWSSTCDPQYQPHNYYSVGCPSSAIITPYSSYGTIQQHPNTAASSTSMMMAVHTPPLTRCADSNGQLSMVFTPPVSPENDSYMQPQYPRVTAATTPQQHNHYNHLHHPYTHIDPRQPQPPQSWPPASLMSHTNSTMPTTHNEPNSAPPPRLYYNDLRQRLAQQQPRQLMLASSSPSHPYVSSHNQLHKGSPIEANSYGNTGHSYHPAPSPASYGYAHNI